ncbi:serine arginine-rich splicing factor 4-like isoform X14 [Labeo rohita]|uniref:Serine arginine-rich splicing factor 4-like isoform X14 n=1 Tax=Labeo rohita TaxID=84645 RepID=A0A498NVF4_LABRO|nr:serine arginine-rich splicing factor 4-like isoform X14 [Labeo rohita]
MQDAVTETGRWAFPLPCGVFQKKVLSLLVDIRHRLKETQPASSAVHIDRMDTMEDFELQEQSLSDAQAFDTLVLQISRIGGRNTKDCAHKVLDRLFTNSLMAKFNLKGKGKRGKRPLEGTKVYRAIQEGIMKFDKAATEEFIKGSVSEHLKHAPQRTGGGGFSMP